MLKYILFLAFLGLTRAQLPTATCNFDEGIFDRVYYRPRGSKILYIILIFMLEILDSYVTMIEDAGEVAIMGYIKGISTGKHGFHIHEFGDLSDSCKACGGHFNPYGVRFL